MCFVFMLCSFGYSAMATPGSRYTIMNPSGVQGDVVNMNLQLILQYLSIVHLVQSAISTTPVWCLWDNMHPCACSYLFHFMSERSTKAIIKEDNAYKERWQEKAATRGKQSGSDSPDSPNPKHRCDGCADIISTTTDALNCSRYQVWLHRYCAGVPMSRFTAITSSFIWLACSIMANVAIVAELRSEIAALKD